tara:strand:+ start:303 stop:1142 length:840 start_codon:yes stop_codon:yes gene_type:complete
MIIWLASYPKSGNTLLRSILATYFFSEDGIFNFNHLYKIGAFPYLNVFEKIGIDKTDREKIFKNYLLAQKTINKEKEQDIHFFKTHSCLFEHRDYSFTNLENTLGAIYIVRDPRNIVTSYAHHYQLSNTETIDRMSDKNLFIKSTKIHADTFLSSWNNNYLSWKKLKDRVLLIKYEDLVNNKKKTLMRVFDFLQKIGMKISVDINKLEKIIKSTEFEKMQDIEKKSEFDEAVVDKKTGNKKPFFNLGPKNQWKEILDIESKIKIEKLFKNEMQELGYLL